MTEESPEVERNSFNGLNEDVTNEVGRRPVTTIHRVPLILSKTNNHIFRIMYVFYIISFVAYVFVRIHYTLDGAGFNRIYRIIVLVAEIVSAMSLILQEPLEVVAATVHEIINMDLPSDLHMHVYVLDDGKRQALESWVLSNRTKEKVYLHYVARPKFVGLPHHAKAGNINHTLHFIYDSCEPKEECVVIFDADFIPRRDYLVRVLPLFSEKRERTLALVQTPQFFYDINPDEDVWDHLNTSFFHRIEPSLDRWCAVNCCGTNFTVRADALKDVGYFPVGCVTEDTLLSLRLCTKGWGVAYHNEILAVGQSPHLITEIFKQRSRWCKGNMQILLNDFPLLQWGLSFSQRIMYTIQGLSYLSPILIPFFHLIPCWITFFGVWPVSAISAEFVLAFITHYTLNICLLLYPPPGFKVRDMWNGMVATSNFWYTYFKAAVLIVGTKLFGRGDDVAFKSMKKKTEHTSKSCRRSAVEDFRACYMHLYMIFILLTSVLCAVAQLCTEKHFVFRYTFTITVMATLINMTPYCIVVVYCWYQTRIPGVWVSCFRYFHTLLHCICALMLILQAFTENHLQNDASSVQSQGDSIGTTDSTQVTFSLVSKVFSSRNH